MITYYPEPQSVDPMLQRLVRRIAGGHATAEEIEQARLAANLSPLEAILVAEFLQRELATTFLDELSHPLCC